MDAELDSEIAEIAKKNGVLLDKTDPIMIMATLNKIFLRDASIAQEEILEAFKSEMEGVESRWEFEAKSKAERILNASLDASKSTIEKVLQESAKEASLAFKKDIEEVLNNFRNSQQLATRVATLNICASILSIFSVAMLIFAVFFK